MFGILLGTLALTVLNLNFWFSLWAYKRVRAEEAWSERARELPPSTLLEMAAAAQEDSLSTENLAPQSLLDFVASRE